jgi:serine/threonine-protein kinase
VYLAQTVGTEISSRVAIKVLHAERAAVPGFVKRLRDEARMLSLIRHRAIVRVDDLVQIGGSWSIIMEYVDGCDLSALLRQGPLPPRAAVEIAAQVAGALHAAYTQAGPTGAPLHLVHRDVKPSNIRLTAQGDVKLLDFGVARAEFEEREAMTASTGFGTITYMSPERFAGRDSHSSDVYALGVTLFEMLTGRAPGPSAMEPDRQPPGVKLVKEWASIAAINEDLHALVASMLASEAEPRPSARSCARQLDDLRGALLGEALEDWSEAAVARFQETIVRQVPDAESGSLLVATTMAVPAPVTEAPTSRWPMVLAVLGLLAVVTGGAVLLGAGGLGWWWMTRPPPAAPVTVTAPAPTPPLPSTPPAATPPVEAPSVETPPLGTPDATTTQAATTPTTTTKAQDATATRARARETAKGRLTVSGDAKSVRVSGPTGSFSPGELPAGSYTAEVTFEAGDPIKVPLKVEAGKTTTLACKSRFKLCTPTIAD